MDIKPALQKVLDFLATFRAFARSIGQKVNYRGWPGVASTPAWPAAQKCVAACERLGIDPRRYLEAQFHGLKHGECVNFFNVADRVCAIPPNGWDRWNDFVTIGAPPRESDPWTDQLVEDIQADAAKLAALRHVRPDLSTVEALTILSEFDKVRPEFLAAFPEFVNGVVAPSRNFDEVKQIVRDMHEDCELRRSVLLAMQKAGL